MQTEITIIIMAVNHAEDKNTSNQSHQGQRSLFFFNLKKYIYIYKRQKSAKGIYCMYIKAILNIKAHNSHTTEGLARLRIE